MSKFTDENGTVWAVRVTINVYRELRSDFDVDLLAPDGIQRVLEDRGLWGEVLISVCDRERQQRSITVDDLDFLLAEPKTYIAASEALAVALADFCRANGSDEIATVLNKTMKAMKTASSVATKRLEGASMERLIAKATKKAEVEIDRAMAMAEEKLDSTTEMPPSDGSKASAESLDPVPGT